MAVARYRMICLVLENSRLPTKLHTELPTISVYGCSGQPYLHGKIAMGSLLRCQLSCSLFPYMKGVASLICMAKFLWAAHSAAHWAAHYLYLDAVGCPLSFPLFPYMEVMGSLICMAKFPWAAHGQPTPLPMCSPWAAEWAAPLWEKTYVGTVSTAHYFRSVKVRAAHWATHYVIYSSAV